MTSARNIHKTDKSAALLRKAQNYMPGGVNSPVRSFNAVGGIPRFIKSAKGAYLTDVDNHHYIDYVGSWGPMLLGHTHPTVVEAVQKAAAQGLSFGTPCEAEVLLAEKITKFIPSMQSVRLVSSGTEAAMSAVRLARAATRRDKIIKFEGCYHGHADSFLVKAGSGALTFDVPSSPGVPRNVVEDTLTATFNDLDSVKSLFQNHSEQIAAVVLEPIAANMNVIPATTEFLRGLRQLCDQHSALLVFDEVITGFRVAAGGAQALYGVIPDLTILGKIIGGGMPVGAYGGRAELMKMVAPEGPVYQAGTLSGNPVAMAAGLATLQLIEERNIHAQLTATTTLFATAIEEKAHLRSIPLTVNTFCGLIGLFFTEKDEVIRYKDVIACDMERFKQFFHAMLRGGIYLAPSPYEAIFLSTAHGEKEINKTLEVIDTTFKGILCSSAPLP